jgi:hypothetical protein
MLPSGMAPANLHLRDSTKARFVDGDMFDICGRLAEISPRLYIVELTDADNAAYVIMESCDDLVQRQVYKLEKGQELDARVLTKVQYLLNVPFEHRLKVIDAENAKYEADHHENILEETYEKMGGQFRKQLEHDGFITHRGTSYPLTGPRQRAGRPRPR